MDFIFSTDWIKQLGLVQGLIIAFFVGMFAFWREMKMENKDRNSILDGWMFSTFFMISWGRLSYILISWSGIFRLPWSLVPYERYDADVYIFRLLPWKLFAIWDGGILFSGLWMGFVVSSFIYVAFFKRWSLKEVFPAIIISSEVFLGLIFFVYGVVTSERSVFLNSIYILLGVGAYAILRGLIKLISTRWKIQRVDAFLKYFFGLFVVLSYSVTAYIFLSKNISDVDRFNVWILVGVVGLMLSFYIFDLTYLIKPRQFNYKLTKASLPVPNQAIKIDLFKRGNKIIHDKETSSR